jgi:hypothetical protein
VLSILAPVSAPPSSTACSTRNPISGQLVRQIPIAVVDNDRTDLSRRIIQALDADEAISIAVRAPALDVAQIALAPPSPIEPLMKPLYNPTGGYASYVVPAAFMLILQQTLLIGAATLAGLGFEDRGSASRMMPIGPASLLGRGLARLTVVCAADRAQLPALVADRNQRQKHVEYIVNPSDDYSRPDLPAAEPRTWARKRGQHAFER